MVPRSRKNATSYFNVMVVGFAGVGKTSFIRTLLETLKIETAETRRDSLLSLPKDVTGPVQRTTQPYTVTVETEIEGDKVALTLIDTPGFQVDYRLDKHLHEIISYIEQQFDQTLAEENKVKRNPKATDTQVHACLYFIDPAKRQLDDYDVRILSRLATRVNVIPVLGKAETLTKAQRSRLKTTIMESLYSTHKIPLYAMPEIEEVEAPTTETKDTSSTSSDSDAPPPSPTSLAELLQQVNLEDEDDETQALIAYLRLAPFAVIAYEEDPDTGLPLPMEEPSIRLGRDYGWGRIDCLSSDYSDFGRLKSMLLTTHRRYLITETIEGYYEKYRTERLLVKRATKMKSMQVNQEILQDLLKM